MPHASELWTKDNRALRAIMESGHALSGDDLAGWEYRGVALGLPAFVERWTWKTFVKAFWRDEGAEHVRGWNVRVVQDGQAPTPLQGSGPLTLAFKQKQGKPFSFGEYRVTPLPSRLPFAVAAGVLLDYGLETGLLDSMHLVRDPLVAINPGDPTQLLGWTYLQLGPLQLPTPSWFTLERMRPVSHVHAKGPQRLTHT